MEAACSANSVCEDIGCESNLVSLNCKESNTEDQQYGCTNMKDTVEIEIQEDCNSCFGKKDSFIDKVVGVPAGGVPLQDSHALFSGIDATSIEDDVANSVEISTLMESGLSVSFDGSVEKCLSKSATFPSSELDISHSFCVEENVASPNTAASSEGISIDQFPTYKRSVSLPAPSKLVSAMKGGRAQTGLVLRLGLRVTWALDVYDPPVSPMFQTIQSNNHRRSKSKKKDKHRHKHTKIKTKRFSSS